MTDTDTVVVGAGHAGLAVSRLLSAAGHEHVIVNAAGSVNDGAPSGGIRCAC